MILLKMVSSSTQELEQALLTFASAIVENVVVSQTKPCTQQSSSVPDCTVVNNAPVLAPVMSQWILWLCLPTQHHQIGILNTRWKTSWLWINFSWVFVSIGIVAFIRRVDPPFIIRINWQKSTLIAWLHSREVLDRLIF